MSHRLRNPSEAFGTPTVVTEFIRNMWELFAHTSGAQADVARQACWMISDLVRERDEWKRRAETARQMLQPSCDEAACLRVKVENLEARVSDQQASLDEILAARTKP